MRKDMGSVNPVIAPQMADLLEGESRRSILRKQNIVRKKPESSSRLNVILKKRSLDYIVILKILVKNFTSLQKESNRQSMSG